MAKFDKQSLCQKFFLAHHFFMYMLSIFLLLVQSIIQIDFPVYALSKHKQNPNLKANRGKNGKVHKVVICQKYFSGIKILHANVQCVYIA